MHDHSEVFVSPMLTLQPSDWRNPTYRKEYFHRLARELNISQPTDWYKVTRETIEKYGGQTLLKQYYGNSVYKVCERTI